MWCWWTYKSLILHLVAHCLIGWYLFWVCCPSFHLVLNSDTGKKFWIINEYFWVVIMKSPKTWVHCWWWNFFINIWVNVFYFFFSDCILIFVINSLFPPCIFSVVFYMCINNASVFMGIVYRIFMVVWVLTVTELTLGQWQ